MGLASAPLTSLSQEQRAQALERYTIIRPALEKQITLAEVACTHHLSFRTVQRWIKNYREQGLAGLADAVRADKRVVAREEEEGEERGPRATPCRPLRFFLDDVEPEMADPVTRSIFPSSSPGILRGQRTREAPARKRYRAADA